MCVMHQERLGATETEGTATAVGDPSTVSKKKTKSSQECGKSHSSGVTWGYNGGGGGEPVFGLELSGGFQEEGRPGRQN